jgi:hypothetical protein
MRGVSSPVVWLLVGEFIYGGYRTAARSRGLRRSGTGFADLNAA